MFEYQINAHLGAVHKSRLHERGEGVTMEQTNANQGEVGV